MIYGAPGQSDSTFNEYPPLTDLGNAERLIEQYGDDLLYCFTTKSWYFYDRTRWKADDQGQVYRFAASTVRSILSAVQQIYERAREAAETQDDKEYERLMDMAEAMAKWGRSSESRNRLDNMVTLARPMVAINPSQFHTDPWLLNVLNGTLDLRTGRLRDQDRQNFITKLAPVETDPQAQFQLWDRFTQRILPDEDDREFVQRAMGYSITGLTSEEKLFFAYGPPATGKSTLLRAIGTTLGDYAAVADFSTFLASSNGQHNDLARLPGRRLVVSIEVEEGQKMAESLVQSLTGGDIVTARFLYSEFFEFVPRFKLWLGANNRPRVRDDNAAMWRRLVQIPFTQEIPEEEQDPEVKRVLCESEAAKPAILRWLVEGCLRWQEEGLNIPQSVRDLTGDYRRRMNPLTEFLDDSCVLFEEARVPRTDLLEAYRQWCGESGIRYPLGRNTFYQRVEALEGVSISTSQGRDFYRGIGLVGDPE
jgi:putative DNA primase/helicase